MKLTFAQHIQYILDKLESKKPGAIEEYAKIILHSIEEANKRIESKTLEKIFHKWNNQILNDPSEIKNFLNIIFKYSSRTVANIAFRNLKNKKTKILLTNAIGHKMLSKDIVNDKWTTFSMADNLLIIRLKENTIIIQERIEKSSIISINKIVYVLSNNQFYEIKDVVFKIESISETSLKIIVYQSKSCVSDKELIINRKKEQYVVWRNSKLELATRPNLANVICFKKQQNEWILIAENELVWRFLGSPLEGIDSNSITDPLGIEDDSLIKCDASVYKINIQKDLI